MNVYIHAHLRIYVRTVICMHVFTLCHQWWWPIGQLRRQVWCTRTRFVCTNHQCPHPEWGLVLKRSLETLHSANSPFIFSNSSNGSESQKPSQCHQDCCILHCWHRGQQCSGLRPLPGHVITHTNMKIPKFLSYLQAFVWHFESYEVRQERITLNRDHHHVQYVSKVALPPVLFTDNG